MKSALFHTKEGFKDSEEEGNEEEELVRAKMHGREGEKEETL